MKSFPVAPLLQRSPPPAARTHRQFVHAGAAQSSHDAAWNRISAQRLPPVASTRHLPYPPLGPHVCVRSMHQFCSAQTFSGGGGGVWHFCCFFFLFFFLFLRADVSLTGRGPTPGVAAMAPSTRVLNADRRVTPVVIVRMRLSNVEMFMADGPSGCSHSPGHSWIPLLHQCLRCPAAHEETGRLSIAEHLGTLPLAEHGPTRVLSSTIVSQSRHLGVWTGWMRRVGSLSV